MAHSVPSPAHESHGHETRDASIRGLVIFGLSLFVTLVLVLVLSARLFWYFARVQSLGPPASPFAHFRTLPPTPRLQADPRRDLQRFREGQRELLSSYGWVDKNAGIVHIPIDRAMDLLVQRGLAVAPGFSPAPAGPPVRSGQASEGVASKAAGLPIASGQVPPGATSAGEPEKPERK